MLRKVARLRTGGTAKLLLTGALALVALHFADLPAAAPRLATPPAPVAPATPKAAPAPVETPFVVKRVLEIETPFTHGDFVWDDTGVPAGPIVITVDLSAQTLSVFRGGYEIGAAVILYGADNKPTPLGVFPITEKDADHVSNLYDAPMPYMLRLTNDGVSIHGSQVEWGSATNGCIGVPTEFARRLFAVTKLGDQVIVTNGQRLSLGQPLGSP